VRFLLRALVAGAAIHITGAVPAMATEEAEYTTVERDGAFEIRDNDPQVLAETIVDGDLEQAGNAPFSRLLEHISGGNRSRAKLAMTAPVGQELRGSRWAVSFTIPASSTVDTLPAPENPLVTLRAVPPPRMAAVRYSGTWSEQRHRSHVAKLGSWIGRRGLAVAGDTIWARDNPPCTPWFLRRNEILTPIEVGSRQR
jgi:hypothetical protein